MKKTLKIVAAFIGVAAVLGAGWWLVTERLLPRDAASIGIIGSADGPTSILVSSDGLSHALLTLALNVLKAIVAVCAAVYAVYRGKKRDG